MILKDFLIIIEFWIEMRFWSDFPEFWFIPYSILQWSPIIDFLMITFDIESSFPGFSNLSKSSLSLKRTKFSPTTVSSSICNLCISSFSLFISNQLVTYIYWSGSKCWVTAMTSILSIRSFSYIQSNWLQWRFFPIWLIVRSNYFSGQVLYIWISNFVPSGTFRLYNRPYGLRYNFEVNRASKLKFCQLCRNIQKVFQCHHYYNLIFNTMKT